jgi:hypothetical protein
LEVKFRRGVVNLVEPIFIVIVVWVDFLMNQGIKNSSKFKFIEIRQNLMKKSNKTPLGPPQKLNRSTQ